MADIVPPSQNDKTEEEPLIPMPSIDLTPKNSGSSTSPASDNSDSKLVVTPAPAEPLIKSPAIAPQATPTSTSSGNDSLDDIKQKTLTELKPLLDEIDLPAEEKFQTILEIISATNDKELIPKLFDAAEGIEDKHERAQALVDVLSEIEFLTGEKTDK